MSKQPSKLQTKIESLDQDDIQKLSPNEGSMLYKAKEDTLGLLANSINMPNPGDDNSGQKTSEESGDSGKGEGSESETKHNTDETTPASGICKRGDEFFYLFNLNGKLISACYGVLCEDKLHYALLFDKKEADSLNMNEEDLKKCVMYFVDKVLRDTSGRRSKIMKDPNKRIQVEFQIDLSGQFPLLSDYSFMKSLGLRDKKGGGANARIFNIVV